MKYAVALVAAAAAGLLASSAHAANFGFDDGFWGNSIGTVTTDGSSPLTVDLDPAAAQNWISDPTSFHGLAIAPAAPGYYGNSLMMGSDQTWMHYHLVLNFSDGSSSDYDKYGGWGNGIEAAMIAPESGTANGGAVGPDINFTGTGATLGGMNGAYLNLYNWQIGRASDSGKTVSSASMSVQMSWSEGGLTYNVFEIPTDWSASTVTYNNLVNAAVPEPASLGLLGLGALALLRRR